MQKSERHGKGTKGRDAMDVDSAADSGDSGGGDDDDREKAAMARLMGFSSFRSTKNTKVPGNDKNYGVRKGQMAVYRQYMNRIGGFNRPLSPS